MFVYLICPMVLQNQGHMTSPPRVDAINSKPVVVLEYSDGDPCGSAHYHTSVTLMCSMEEVSLQ